MDTRKRSLVFFTSFVIFAMLLAACQIALPSTGGNAPVLPTNTAVAAPIQPTATLQPLFGAGTPTDTAVPAAVPATATTAPTIALQLPAVTVEPTETAEPTEMVEATSASMPTEAPEATEAPTQAENVTNGTSAVTVEDQDLQDGQVKIDDVLSPGPGWIVIHAQANGNPGPVIGIAHLDPGENKDVKVGIDVTKATPVLYAMLHVDAGLVNVYEFPGADVPVMNNGQMVSPAFNVQGAIPTANTPFVSTVDQPLSNGMVIVPEVISTGPGWIVIHADLNDSPGAVIGHAAVKDGINFNVIVNVDPSQVTPKLYAMLHVDAGQAGVFEFPGADTPATVNGEVVSDDFDILAGNGNLQPAPTVAPAIVAPTAAPASNAMTITMQNFSFNPKSITIPVGTTVVWTNKDSTAHTATADIGAFDSGTVNPGGSFQFTFTMAGTYAYYCRFHGGPNGQGMSGTIVVK